MCPNCAGHDSGDTLDLCDDCFAEAYAPFLDAAEECAR